MKHWTQESAKDFAYSVSLDFFTQLQSRLEESPMTRKAYADKLGLTPGRVSQIFNDPPNNPKLERVVEYALALGMKVSLVAYDDGDPENDKGPIFSGVFSDCWRQAGSPRDLSESKELIDVAILYAVPQITESSFYRPDYWSETHTIQVQQTKTTGQVVPVGPQIGQKNAA